jgi:ankyrin repeat protein
MSTINVGGFKTKSSREIVEGYIATKRQRLDGMRVEYLIRKHGSLEGALTESAEKGELEDVKLLISAGANAKNSAALYGACYFGHLEVVRVLLDHGADCNAAYNPPYNHPLVVASGKGHLEIARLLIDRGAAVNITAENGDGDGDMGYTLDGQRIDQPLEAAASGGHLEVARLLLDHGADISVHNGMPLRLACGGPREQIDVVRLFFDCGAVITGNFDNVVGEGDTNGNATIVAAACGHVNILRLLIAHGANAWVRLGQPLSDASEIGHTEVVRILLDAMGDMTGRDDLELALKSACRNGHLGVVRALIDRGADIHTETDAPLRFASFNGHWDVVKFLLDNKANVHADNGRTLQLTVNQGHHGIAQKSREAMASSSQN